MNVFDVSIQQAIRMMAAEYENAVAQGRHPMPFFLQGPPGVGKTTSIVQGLSKLLNLPVHAEDNSGSLPEDLKGIPFSGEEGYTDFRIRKSFAPFVGEDSEGILVMDDITQAIKGVKVASRQSILARQFGDAVVGKRVLIVATGNRREDNAGATPMPAHWLNAVCVLNVVASPTEFAEWLRKQAAEKPGQYDAPTVAYVNYAVTCNKPIIQSPSDATEVLGSFATPRQWENLARTVGAHHPDDVRAIGYGLVGAPAHEWAAFRALADTVIDPEACFRDPLAAVPDPESQFGGRPDAVHAAVTALTGYSVTAMKLGGVRWRVAESWARAVWHVSTSNKEMLAIALDEWPARHGSAKDLMDCITKSTDPAVEALASFLMPEEV